MDTILQFRALMDAGVSVLINLGGLESDVQRFLGCLLTVGIEEEALSRADTPEERRRPFHLIIDEFPLFSAQSGLAMERVLSLTRKYGLLLTLANQTWGQVPTDLRSALQNTTFITFRLGSEDAAWAAGRVGTIDPTRTKRTPQGREVLVAASEQREEWEQRLAHLRTGEALLRLDGQTIPFRTLQVPSNRGTREGLRRVKLRYAQLLLTPRTSDTPGTAAMASTLTQEEHRAPQQSPAADKTSRQGGTRSSEGRRSRHQRFERLAGEDHAQPQSGDLS